MEMKDKRIIIGVCFIILLSLFGNVFLGYKLISRNNDNVSDTSNGIALLEEKKEEVEEVIVVREFTIDIKGAVKKPGVYKLKEGSRIQDAIKKAGGLKSGASTKNINLSKKISDEMVIYIYKTSELKKINTISTCNVANEIISSCEGTSVIEIGDNDSSSSSKKVSINTGTLEQLMTLDGVGESKAKAIISYREDKGPFTSLDQIMNVSGIGEAAYSKIKDYITL